MISRIHQRLGTAGFVISIIALVAALGGGAYAASGGLSSKQKKEVEKIAKKVAKPGPTGPVGASGPAGAKGDKGDPGSAGGAGANGESVTITTASSAECKDGGTKFSNKTGAGKACNGTTGFASELPPGQTETGTWAFGSTSKEQEEEFYPLQVPVSFPFTLASGEYPVTFIPEGVAPTSKCPGSPAEPLAEPGVVCVYETSGEGATYTTARNPEVAGKEKAGRNGVILFFTELKEFGFGYGTWAVTAEEG